MAKNYYDTNTGTTFTERVLFELKHFPRNPEVLKERGIYPIQYDYIEYDPITQAMRPFDTLEFDEANSCYRQKFYIEQLSEERIAQNRQQDTEAKFEQLRTKRNAKIAETDYLAYPDYPLSDAKRSELNAYRQALRDLPKQEGAPWDGGNEATPWPTFEL